MLEFIKTLILKIDLIRFATAATGLIVFYQIGIALINHALPPENKEIAINFIGIVEGVMMTITGYEFGASKSQKKIENTENK
jgi:hypothetical protein